MPDVLYRCDGCDFTGALALLTKVGRIAPKVYCASCEPDARAYLEEKERERLALARAWEARMKQARQLYEHLRELPDA